MNWQNVWRQVHTDKIVLKHWTWETGNSNITAHIYGSKYLRMNQVKFVEDSL